MSQPQGAPPVAASPFDSTANELTSPQANESVPLDAITRINYFRGLGIVYLIAFLSLWTQIHGLVGEQGLLPVTRFFKLVHEKYDSTAYHLLPSVVWLNSTDVMLHFWCAVGTILSIVLIIGLAPRFVLVGLWVVYLSLISAGQDFLSFQWDTLLLEMTLCSVLYAPSGLRPDWKMAIPPSWAARWLLWGLTFKLLFLSGVTKLLSGDSSWSDGTALQFHYYTQPIPSWISWYAYQFPLGVHQLSLWVMFVIEIILPFLIFAGVRGRAVFGLATIALMMVIELTGNFGFFNLQTSILCIPLLNDALFRRSLAFLEDGRSWPSFLWRKAPERFRHLLIIPTIPSADQTTARRSTWSTAVEITLATTILFISLLTGVREMVRTQDMTKVPAFVVNSLNLAERLLLSWSKPRLLDPIFPFHSINGYGLFRVMTTHRPEIVVEISDDGRNWVECEFPYKPGSVDRAPAIVAPHMPRLDWQMWFAGLNPTGNGGWLSSLMQRILEGNPTTARLLGRPELSKNPPKFVRLSYYEYRFSSPEQKRNTSAWWSRSHTGYLTNPISRQNLH